MKNSKIEWTHHTFNPWWGCVKVSEACAHCYAEAFAKRTGHDIWGPDKPRRFFGAEHWQEPFKWDADARARGVSERVFCASMADVFEDYQGPDKDKMEVARLKLWVTIETTPNLDWLLLTKRPENVLKMVPSHWSHSSFPSHVWLGTTVENQDQANIRIPHLLSIPAKVRFLSCEPLLGPVDLRDWLPNPEADQDTTAYHNHKNPKDSIHWVICGGESGPGARPMHPDWARSLRDQCQVASVPFFFKQWGDLLAIPEAAKLGIKKPIAEVLNANTLGGGFLRVGKARAGRLLDGCEWSEFPFVQPSLNFVSLW